MGNKIISVLEQLKQNGQLNDYLIDDDERKWTKLVYDILVNKFDYPFGRETMQQANQIYNDSVVAWKGQGKMTDLMGRAGFGEGKESNKRLIRLTESDLHRIVKESVQNILKETYDPCDELGHIRWRNRDYRNNSDDAQRVGKKRGEALANWNKRVKDSENKTVEESVNEVMYNGVSYHGTNPYDWVDIADERSQMGWKNRDDVSKYNQARFKAKDQGDLEGAEAASIMADKHRQQWNKNWGAAERNRNNAKQLGWQGQNDTRLGKAQEYYNMSQNAQNPQDRQRYNQMAQNTLGDVEGRANQALKRLRGENVIKRAVEESVQNILKEMGDDNYPRLSVEKSRPGDVPPGDQDIHYPGDVNPDVLDSLQRGDFGESNAPMYKEGDVVYWMYYYSSTFPNFYKVIKVGPKSIWISKMGTKRTNATMGYGSWDSIPDETNVSDKVKRIALRPNGKAYINYVGHKQELQVWNGRPIQSMSD